MHRIDHPTAVAVRPAPAAAGTPGYFTGGDPLAGQEATWVTEDWLNDVQENIAQVIEAFGALAKGDGTQLLLAIRGLISTEGGLPIGVPVPWMGSVASIPANCVPLMGQTLPRSLYPLATNHALTCGIVVTDADWLAQAVHRTKFSLGDGLNTIRLPELRAELIYGADIGRGVRGGNIGDWLADDLKPHNHPATSNNDAGHDHGGLTSTNGDHNHGFEGSPAAGNPDAQGADAGASMLDLTQFVTKYTSVNGAHQHGIPWGGVHNHIINVLNAGGSETRQRGVGYPYIMRVK